jgi:hypothetical protein
LPQEIKEETDINQDWQNIKEVILDAATEFQSAKGVKEPNHWWDDECKKAIQEKSEARRTRLIRKTRANLDIYQQKRIKANRTCGRKKKEWLERKIKEINEKNRKKDKRKFYKDIRYLTNLPITMTLVCKDKNGKILSDKRQTQERWQKYFKELLNSETTRINSINIHEGPELRTTGANI